MHCHLQEYMLVTNSVLSMCGLRVCCALETSVIVRQRESCSGLICGNSSPDFTWKKKVESGDLKAAQGD